MAKKSSTVKVKLDEGDGYEGGNGDDDKTVAYTDIQQQFLDLLKKYPVNLPETIVDYVTSQGENVLEDPVMLAKALRECEISPVRRHQILRHWFADKGLQVSEDILNWVASNKPFPPEGEGKEGNKKVKDKFSVDNETGSIVVASSPENAVSYEEALKLSEKRKAELKDKEKGQGPKYVYDPEVKAIRMAKDGEQGGTLDEAKELKKMAEADNKDKPESPFMQTADGQWAIVPGAKLTIVEMMTWESMKKAAAAGQPVDPITAMIDNAEKWKSVKEIFSGGSSVPAYLQTPEAFAAAVKVAMGGDNEAVKSLTAELQKLREEQHAAELRQRDQAIADLRTKAESDKNELLQKMEEVKKEQRTTGKSIYDIVDRFTNKFPDSNDAIKALQTITQNPPKFPTGAPGDVSKRLESAASKLEEAGALKKAGDAWFNLG